MRTSLLLEEPNLREVWGVLSDAMFLLYFFHLIAARIAMKVFIMTLTPCCSTMVGDAAGISPVQRGFPGQCCTKFLDIGSRWFRWNQMGHNFWTMDSQVFLSLSVGTFQ